MRTNRLIHTTLALLVLIVAGGCGDSGFSGPAPMPGPMPVHLEDLLDAAEITGAEVDADLAAPWRWQLSQGAAGWQALPALVADASPAEVEAEDGRVHLRLTAASRAPAGSSAKIYGGIYIDAPDFDLDDWSEVLVEAKVSESVQWIAISYNLRQAPGQTADEEWPTRFYGSEVDVNSHGEVAIYRTRVVSEGGPVTEPIREVAIEFGATGPAEIELLSIALLPASATYAEAGLGVRSVSSSAHQDFGPQRRAIYSHVPSRIAYPLSIPTAGRLDLALGAFGGEMEMAVRVDYGDSTTVMLDERVPPETAWRQHSIDLSRWAGRDVTLTLEAESEVPAIAFWASPTVSSDVSSGPDSSGTAGSERANVIFYVIDGASANLMSVYGYDRPTTPNLERIAREGVVFERAFSNATWTMPSTASFMTSLHHSVLGGLRNGANPVPPNVKTMAEHFHDASFHTGVFTFNPNAGGPSGLNRAVDVFRDFGKRGAPLDPIEAISSKVLHEQFWQWRDAYPGSYWVHFQTTDVHPPHHPQKPFKGRLVAPERSEELARQMLRMRFPFGHTAASVHEHWQGQLAQQGLEPREFYATMRDMHDEAMMHQDQRLGELVDELKHRGEWQNTLLIIASDHGHPAASYPRFGRGLLDPQPSAWEGALLGEFESHVPMIFVWPGHIEGGRRIEHAVSMIDVLPTLLDLVGLPQPEIAQGQSLAPLLLGEEGWEPRPVVFDEFRVVDDGSLIGNLEILDGRWGQSLEIRTSDELPPPLSGRHPAPAGGRWPALNFEDVPRLLLYDIEDDPRAIQHVTAEHPEVAERARRRLWRQWQEHQDLAALFEAGQEAELSPEQIESLKALGYVQ